MGMKCLNVPEWNVTIAAAPKCGSSSVRFALAEAFGVDDVERLVYCPNVRLLSPELVTGKTLFVTRHPIDRWESCWRNKCRDGGKLSNIDADVHGMTPEEFFEFQETVDNHHWTPLSKMRKDIRGHILDVPLEDLDVAWAALLPQAPKLQKYNQTEGVCPLTPGLMDKLMDRYADDLDLYEYSLNWRNNL